MDSTARLAALLQAKAGNETALGQLLDSYRPYLVAIARARRQGKLLGKFGESDLTQDALLEAHRHFSTFRGSSLEEFAGWLRQIVIRTTSHAVRDQLDVSKRAADREQPLDGLTDVVPGDLTTPSGQAMRHERSAQLAAAVSRLPEDMQTVILGRHDRSEGAVRVLYTRALRRLREECQADLTGESQSSRDFSQERR